MVYYEIKWTNWLTKQEQSIVILKTDVVKFVAVLLNSVAPDDIYIKLAGKQQTR